ncbi:hypothetical protein EDEG_02766 [Edhazardia aedis USNM 41457]|uniref:Uncharacterized protein n=1 Tax=Edhazardia aedis (strain USNM 41457) TaxID=1003232 RepID=J9DJM5_EDHAE|nr:hypothetical protein EDEG_02766 [Edhazardia aedis USNM 41457]|eukprot:EJW02825.1 hypothetical protein EDEG_02766 [Edhazardia aedis USNM 41457]
MLCCSWLQHFYCFTAIKSACHKRKLEALNSNNSSDVLSEEETKKVKKQATSVLEIPQNQANPSISNSSKSYREKQIVYFLEKLYFANEKFKDDFKIFLQLFNECNLKDINYIKTYKALQNVVNVMFSLNKLFEILNQIFFDGISLKLEELEQSKTLVYEKLLRMLNKISSFLSKYNGNDLCEIDATSGGALYRIVACF